MENLQSKFEPLLEAIQNANENVHYQDFIRNFFRVCEIVKKDFKLLHFQTLDKFGNFDLFLSCTNKGVRLSIQVIPKSEPFFYINGFRHDFEGVVDFIINE